MVLLASCFIDLCFDWMQVFSVRCETNLCKNIFLFLRYATLINKPLELMRNILVMHSRSLTFDINKVQMILSVLTVLLHLKSSVRQH